MRKKRREYLLPHYGQIVTTRHAIYSYLSDIDMDIGYNTALLIALGREHKDYYLRLYSICSKLCFLSKLIYRCEGGYRVWGDQDYIKMEEKYGEDITKEDIEDYMKNRKGFAKLPQIPLNSKMKHYSIWQSIIHSVKKKPIPVRKCLNTSSDARTSLRQSVPD